MVNMAFSYLTNAANRPQASRLKYLCMYLHECAMCTIAVMHCTCNFTAHGHSVLGSRNQRVMTAPCHSPRASTFQDPTLDCRPHRPLCLWDELRKISTAHRLAPLQGTCLTLQHLHSAINERSLALTMAFVAHSRAHRGRARYSRCYPLTS
jgi:hypothetical protein